MVGHRHAVRAAVGRECKRLRVYRERSFKICQLDFFLLFVSGSCPVMLRFPNQITLFDLSRTVLLKQ
jgi:hypothetical protein